ncbi:MAG: helix-turn-helix domain-containing protein [Eubacteriales bacterium]|nr:helix-turn-helix domain-containing protein [Eubacteriales bacterium]
MNVCMEFAIKMSAAYTMRCKSLCRELKMPQTAFDILMFLANNPNYSTARDIVEIRKLKANLVSVNVNRLVEEGYLRRETVDGDRRKTKLLCTQKAEPIIERGRSLQTEFFESLFANTDEQAKRGFFDTMDVMSVNLNKILEGDR